MTDPRRVTWHSFDLRSGRRGSPLVTKQRGTLQRIIGEATEAQLDVSFANSGPDVAAATQPGTTMLVALDDDDESIIWGGMVLRRVSHEDEWVTHSLSTLEHYLDRRYVGDLGFLDVDQASIAAALMATVAGDGPHFTVDAPLSGQLLTRIYADDEDRTVLSALTELAEVDGGIEFTVDLEWSDVTRTQINRVFRVRNRIGASRPDPTQWTMPGAVTEFETVEDYTTENGANDVMATSSGEGGTRPESKHAVATDLLTAGWARFEMRYTAATSITSFAQLDAHAVAKLADTRDGLMSLSLVARLDQAPRLNVDWWLGDDIEVSLVCARFPERLGPDGGLVAGYTHRLRVVGWEIDYDDNTLTPNTREVT